MIAASLKKDLDNLTSFTADNEKIVMQKLRYAWTYHSCAIEGNSLTYTEVKFLLLHGITAHRKLLKDHLEIVAHDEAING